MKRTAFLIEVHDGPLTPEIFDELFCGEAPTFVRKVAQIEAACRDIVENPEPYIQEARRRGTLDEDGLRCKRDLPPDLAERLLRLLDLAKSAETVGHDMALRIAFDAGIVAHQLTMKIGREREYLSGLKVRNGAKKGGRQNPDRDTEMAREYLSRLANKRMSRTALMTRIGEKHGLKPRAARYAIDRGRKNIGQNPANCP